ncbi:MAG: carboxypeptidase regulatory-like domain-containing protein [Acidobacteria bacterium]|nr:carboxypeptidase regulatory-like domain-containing protein [Acidobacteriota bacterium]
MRRFGGRWLTTLGVLLLVGNVGTAAAQIRWQPIFEDGFEDGTTSAWSFTEVGDGPDAPELGFTAPAVVVLDDAQPTIALVYDDPDGIDLASFHLQVDGVDQTAGCTVTATSAECLPPILTQGHHLLQAEIASTTGQAVSTSRAFDLFLGPGPHTLVLEGTMDSWVSGSDTTFIGGAAGSLHVGGSELGRALVRVDGEPLRLIGGRNLLSARLEVDVVANGGGWGSGGEVGLHRLVLTPWLEAEASWDCATGPAAGCEAAWEGGVFAAATDTVLHTDDLSGTVVFDALADAQDFQTGTDDYGWLLKKSDEGTAGSVDYGSREGGSPARLELVFEAPPGPGGDGTPPELSFTSPSVPVFEDPDAYEVVLSYRDPGSGVDPSTLRVFEDGADRTGLCLVEPATATCTFPASVAAGNVQMKTVRAQVSDAASNATNVELRVVLIYGAGDTTAPVLIIESPPEGAVVNSPMVEIQGSVLDDGVVEAVGLGTTQVPVVGGLFVGDVALFPGENVVPLVAADGAGHSTMAQRTVTYDPVLPDLDVLEPISGLETNAMTIRVAGLVFDLNGISEVDVAGSPVPVVDGTFETTVPLADGANAIAVRAADAAGNVTEAVLEVTRFSVPTVVITSPSSFELVGASVDVEGTVDPPASTVLVNGVAAPVTSGSFVAPTVPVQPGVDLLTAVATDASGQVGTATVTVVRDARPPQLVLVAPADGAHVFDPSIGVYGRVRDPDLSGAGSPPPDVEVNGQPATVVGDTFSLDSLALNPGDNPITVEATDQVGNTTTVDLVVHLDPATVPHLVVVSGDRQAATISTLLPEPLVVRAVDRSGSPITGVPVLFRVTGGKGNLDGGRRQVAALTDGAGEASANWTLGSRAGVAAQRVEASAVGFGDPVELVADAEAGAPAMVVVDAGAEQVGVAGQALPLPLVASVVDAGFNRLPGVAVDFKVVSGGGTLTTAGSSVGRQTTVVTDRDGNAAVGLILGAEAGTASDVVEATLASDPTGPFASFVASARVAGNPAQTALTGLVLDNSDQPVPGVTLTIEGTALSTQSDDTGAFRLEGVPPGMVLLHALGSTATRPGVWPDLSYQVYAVPGLVNSLSRPVYLLPLDLANAVAVDETTGGTITSPELPGFALDIAPGSVTFADGSRSGVVSVTLVHGDKIPRTPNFGQQPRIIVTIQPARARFNPPARFTLPNVDGLAPGEVTEMYSFDHDLFRFVSIGEGVVSEDGLTVTSVPGFGVLEAGWHCGGNPSGSGTTHNCPDCKKCVRDHCEEDNSQIPMQAAPDDCLRQVCIHGFPFPAANTSETPRDTPGDCRRGECIAFGGGGFGVPPTGRVRELTDLSDPPPGMGCCGTDGSTSSPDIYDPATQCCTHSVHEKHPMPLTWRTECPNRTAFRPPNPGNGCGSPVVPIPVPENPNIGCENASFTSACDGHDMCYDTCGSSQHGCDSQFRAAMRVTCATGCSNVFALAFCLDNADRYFHAVDAVGGLIWPGSQRDACQCC